MALRTTARLKGTKSGLKETHVQHPSGIQKKQINIQELKKNPEKYVNIYPSFYENVNQLQHELNTRSSVKKKLGKKTKVVAATDANTGIVYNVFIGLKKKKKKVEGDKPKQISRAIDKVKKKDNTALINQMRKQSEMLALMQQQIEDLKKANNSNEAKEVVDLAPVEEVVDVVENVEEVVDSDSKDDASQE